MAKSLKSMSREELLAKLDELRAVGETHEHIRGAKRRNLHDRTRRVKQELERRTLNKDDL